MFPVVGCCCHLSSYSLLGSFEWSCAFGKWVMSLWLLFLVGSEVGTSIKKGYDVAVSLIHSKPLIPNSPTAAATHPRQRPFPTAARRRRGRRRLTLPILQLSTDWLLSSPTYSLETLNPKPTHGNDDPPTATAISNGGEATARRAAAYPSYFATFYRISQQSNSSEGLVFVASTSVFVLCIPTV